MGLQHRVFADEQTKGLFELAAELADRELRPVAAAAERDGIFPREQFRLLGAAGLLGLPFPERLGGGGQPYEVYLQVVEELAASWLTVGLGLSVHTLTCFPLAVAGSASSRNDGCRPWSAAACSARTACPSRRAARTPRHSAPARWPTAGTT